jgi:hypothetical protein
MAIEAFVWSYENGEPTPLRFASVLTAFEEAGAKWELEAGCLHLDFGGAAYTCDVFLDPDATETDRVRGLMISRPIGGAALWQAVLRILSEQHAILFFSDDTTPLLWDLQSLEHFPADLIASLGTPVQVRTPEEILAGREH